MGLRRSRFAVLLLIGALAVVGCGNESGQVTVSEVRIGRPMGPNAALYLTASGNGQSDRLVAATTESARSVEIHESTVGDDGTMRMRPVEALEVPEGGSLVLEPGGLHLMLVDVERLEVGDVVEVALMWETAGGMTVEAHVVEPGDTMSHDG